MCCPSATARPVIALPDLPVGKQRNDGANKLFRTGKCGDVIICRAWGAASDNFTITTHSSHRQTYVISLMKPVYCLQALRT